MARTQLTGAVVLFMVLSITIPALGVENISITGDITFDPDISKAWSLPASDNLTKIEECHLATSPEECQSLPGCSWYDDPRGVSPEGRPSEYCAPEGEDPWTDRAPLNNDEPVTLRVDGIQIMAPATMFIFKDTVESTPNPSSLLGTTTVDATRTSASIIVPLPFFGPGKHFFTVCVNDTPCPSWDDACSTCISSEKVVYWTDPETGAVVEVNAIMPTVQLGTPFAGHPSLWEDEIERVTAILEVTTFYMEWYAECRLEGLNEDNSINLDLCGTGAFVPDICSLQPATGESTVEVAIVLTSDHLAWYAGRYRLLCTIHTQGEWAMPGGLDSDFYVERRVPLVPAEHYDETVGDFPVPPRTLPATTSPTTGASGASCGNGACPPGSMCVDGQCVPAPSTLTSTSGSDTTANVIGVLIVVVLGYVLLLPDEKGGRRK